MQDDVSTALDALLDARPAAPSAADVDRLLAAGYGEALALAAARRTLSRRLLAETSPSDGAVIAADLERLGGDLDDLRGRLVAVSARYLLGAQIRAEPAWSAPCPRLDGLPTRDLERGLRVAVARTRRSRMDGLARLDALPPPLGLHIPRCRSVHTFGMRFPLDLVWLDREGAVVRVDHGVPARRVRTCMRARSVVELNAGVSDAFLVAGLAS